MRLKVIVRVRPMSQREKHSGSQQVVAVESLNNISVTNIKVPQQNAGDSRERTRRFAFDYCFSEDISQDQIFETIENIVGNSLKNRNHSCVLAYGQTSSGKTHTMMGFPHDPGMTPRLCRRIFKYFEEGALSDEASRMKVSVSYLEIYNEKVADLLNESDNSKTHGKDKPLKVREHPKKGPYVEGLSQHEVTSDTELLERLQTGTLKRRVGSTTTNPRSSRSHSVFSVSCDGVKLHLVDLAGNERAGSRGYGPSRFREGANINKSLVALGNVISTLADQSRSSSSSRNKFVPYRDSVLTWLLKDTLQGNSNTVVIATVCPSSTYYSETVNTLRFGQRAKLIAYKPIIVEDSKEQTIRELRAEIARLRDLLRLSSQISPRLAPQDQMNHEPSNTIKEIPSEELKSRDMSSSSTLTSSTITSLSEPHQKRHVKSNNNSVDSDTDISLPTYYSAQNDVALENVTTETLVPIMDVKSSLGSTTLKKIKRAFSMDRTNSIETDNSKSFSSQESLQSPKHSRASATSRESSSTSSASKRAAPPAQPKQTALSLRRQSIHRSTPSLKTITQKKILAPSTNKKLEKGVVTDESGFKKTDDESKTDHGKRPLYVKPRAQIVAAVTSRLYSKVNKKDIGTSTENLAPTPKETPPKELSICTNARNRLRDLTQRALKAHRSRNEETQTDLFPIMRVKEAATDCSDLKQELSEVKDAATLDRQDTRDAEVECTLLNQFIEGTLKNILVLTRSCGIQTTADEKATSSSSSSVSFKKYLTDENHHQNSHPSIFTEAVNINISHNYINGNRTGSLSDDSLDNQRNNVSFPTPDLISNHNSLEPHALNNHNSDNSESIEAKICYAASSDVVQDLLEHVSYMPSSSPSANTATVLTVPNFGNNNFKSVDVLTAHAPEVIILKDPLKERCQSLPDFCPKMVRPKQTSCMDTKLSSSSISYHNKPVVHICQDSSSSSESNESEENNFVFNIPDSMEYHIANNHKKVQFAKKNRSQKNERIMKAMKDFLEEAKLLMSNISSAAHNLNVTNCQQPHLDDFDIQVTVNDVSAGQGKRRRKRTRESNATQTDEAPSMESCFSQTSLEFPEYVVPINKYEAVLEDSCKRLEEHISKKTPSRSRHISIASDDDDILFDRFDRPRYNPWDLSNVEVEDSSLESNPVTFSDYGSLPRKTHKRQRTPTCSPSAFLKQLTHMRRQIIESSREELLLNGAGGSK